VVIVNPQTFLAAMRAQWAAYNNTYADKLDLIWLQIVTTLNYQARAEGEARWPVIPAELGIGKTTCAKLWCSMLPAGVSALVVVRTREQAQEFANDVNAWSCEPLRAVALFSPSDALPNEFWHNAERTRAFQVVVVCHKSYELGLDEFSLDAAQKRFAVVHLHQDRRRDVVIVDEALDQVAEARLGRSAMAVLLHLLRRIQYQHHGALRVVESVGRALREAPIDRARALTVSELLALTDYDVLTATAHLDTLWAAVKTEKRMKPEARAIISETFTVLRRHLATAPWTDEVSVSSARLLRMPEGTKGVVLDATGVLNNVYRARKDEFDVCDVMPVRDYTNVTIYEARTNETGKTKVKKAAVQIAEKAVSDLLAHYAGQVSERRLLVVTAADDDTQDAFHARLATAGFVEYAITNWGAVDGRNQWRTFDTLLIVSLHYGSSTQDVNTWLATQDLAPDDETLNAADEVRAIKERRIATTIAQAIGRLRLRTMTKEDGTCEPCDVFVRLPVFKGVVDAEKVMAGVVSTLPRVTRAPWAGASKPLKRDGRAPVARKGVEQALVEYVNRMAPDTWEDVNDVRTKIGATGHGTWFRVQASMADTLTALGARIVPSVGRRPAGLVKGDAAPPEPARAPHPWVKRTPGELSAARRKAGQASAARRSNITGS
jgi:hypothetical protein